MRSGVDVTEIDPEARTATDSDGQIYTGDVVIAADGPQGLGRKLLGGEPGVPSGYAYYRFVRLQFCSCCVKSETLYPCSAVLSAEDAEKIPQIKGGPEAEGVR